MPDTHGPAPAWFPNLNKVPDGLFAASGHFLPPLTVKMNSWRLETLQLRNGHSTGFRAPGECQTRMGLHPLGSPTWIRPGMVFLLPLDTSRSPDGHPRGLIRVKLSQAGSIGGFNDQGGCGCAHPAVRLFPLVPWASGVPRVAHWGAVGIARDPPRFG